MTCKTFSIKYFQVFGMTSKIFQANHQNRWLNIEATSVEGLVTGLLELAVVVRMVAPTTKLLMFTVGAVSSMTGPTTPIDKMTSSVTKPLAHVTVHHLWPLNCLHQSLVRHLLPLDRWRLEVCMGRVKRFFQPNPPWWV